MCMWKGGGEKDMAVYDSQLNSTWLLCLQYDVDDGLLFFAGSERNSIILVGRSHQMHLDTSVRMASSAKLVGTSFLLAHCSS